MKKIPISILIDDPSPVLSVYYTHHKTGKTDDDRTLVSVPATTRDKIWQTIHCTDTSEEYISKVADELITKDGKEGEIIRVLETGGYPILVTHWQSLHQTVCLQV